VRVAPFKAPALSLRLRSAISASSDGNIIGHPNGDRLLLHFLDKTAQVVVYSWKAAA